MDSDPLPKFIHVATNRCILCNSQVKNDETVISDKIAVGKYSLVNNIISSMLIDSKIIGSNRFFGWTKFFVLSFDNYHIQKVLVYLVAKEEPTTQKPFKVLIH